MEQFDFSKPLPLYMKTVLISIAKGEEMSYKGNFLDVLTVCIAEHLVEVTEPEKYKITDLGNHILAVEAGRSASQPTWGDGLG